MTNVLKQKTPDYIHKVIGSFLVPRTRLELARPCEYRPLKLACLLIINYVIVLRMLSDV